MPSLVLDKKKAVWQLFDRIAPRYDFLNRFLSGRQDVRWRKKMAKLVKRQHPQIVLDLATGTGDVVFALDRVLPSSVQIMGMDMSGEMLKIARLKQGQKTKNDRIRFEQADALKIPLSDRKVDAVTIAFGIRNVEDLDKGLSEMSRVLKPGGRGYILEFSLPKWGIVRWGYLAYFRYVLPRLGGWISGDRQAYGYLNESVESFPYGEAFVERMAQAGFSEIETHPLSFGIATLYSGLKR